MKKQQLTEEMFYDWWLAKYHGTTIKKAYEDNPWTDPQEFYERYACTQEQHDEWYAWAIDTISKHYRLSKEQAKRRFAWNYLNVSPTVKKDARYIDVQRV